VTCIRRRGRVFQPGHTFSAHFYCQTKNRSQNRNSSGLPGNGSADLGCIRENARQILCLRCGDFGHRANKCVASTPSKSTCAFTASWLGEYFINVYLPANTIFTPRTFLPRRVSSLSLSLFLVRAVEVLGLNVPGALPVPGKCRPPDACVAFWARIAQKTWCLCVTFRVRIVQASWYLCLAFCSI